MNKIFFDTDTFKLLSADEDDELAVATVEFDHTQDGHVFYHAWSKWNRYLGPRTVQLAIFQGMIGEQIHSGALGGNIGQRNDL